jgi:hypothetical protein
MSAHGGTHTASEPHRFSDLGSATRPAYSGVDPHPAATPEGDGRVMRALQLLGFSVREARLYIELLRNGPLGAREATEGAGLQRATAYRVLLRLLSRGVIVGNGRSPQRFQAVGVDVVTRRLGGFLREEVEVNEMIAEACAALVGGTAPLPMGPMGAPNGDVRLLVPDGTPTHPVLVELAAARESVDVMLRPLSTGLAYRSALARTLGRTAHHGVRVRVMVDAAPADRRFVERLFREGVEESARLAVRHSTPVAAHSYVIDGRRAIRFPILGSLGRPADVAVASNGAAWVKLQRARFDALWTEGIVSPRRRPSTRSFGWRLPQEREPDPILRTSTALPTPPPRGVTPEEFRQGYRVGRPGR